MKLRLGFISIFAPIRDRFGIRVSRQSGFHLSRWRSGKVYDLILDFWFWGELKIQKTAIEDYQGQEIEPKRKGLEWMNFRWIYVTFFSSGFLMLSIGRTPSIASLWLLKSLFWGPVFGRGQEKTERGKESWKGGSRRVQSWVLRLRSTEIYVISINEK